MTREAPGRPVVVGEFTLIPVERTRVETRRIGPVTFYSGSKRPVAIRVRHGDREWRLELPDCDGRDDD